MKQLPLSKLQSLFAAVSADRKLYIPADDAAGQASFTVWQEGMTLTKKLNTVRSAKDLFFPQVENLVGFRVTGRQLDLVETRDPAEPFVLFGVRACDARSFEILDRVFLAEPQDTYYAARRAQRHRRDAGLHPPRGNVLLSGLRHRPCGPAGRYQLLDRGRNALLAGQHGKGRGADREPSHAGGYGRCGSRSPAGKDARSILKKLPLAGLDLSAVGAGKTKELFDRPEWKQLSESCLGCGTCTFVCPTCQCYDIKEFDSGRLVRRFRCWDSCMYSDFTKMSAGQPRPTQLERFRQRFMHKLVYFPDNNDGCFGCVGCGRCLAKCPIHMNIVKVIKTLGEEHA